MDRRVALDAKGLPYPVVVVGGQVWDACLWPFEKFRGAGMPVADVKFK